MEQLRANINHIVSRRAIHPAHASIGEMEAHGGEGGWNNLLRKMYNQY